jgi:hypothetical protein
VSEYRIPLEGGDILVVTLAVEEGTSIAEADPTSLGQALLGLLGGRQVMVGGNRGGKTQAMRRIDPAIRAANEEDAEAWLERTSKEALKGMK